MPVHVAKGKGKRPWKIQEQSGKTVGASETQRKAQASARARNAAFRRKPKR